MNNESTTPLPPGKKSARKAFEIGGVGKGISWRGLMFSVEFKTGDAVAFPYAYIQRLDHDKSGKLGIELATETIEITGRNLGDLYLGLVDHHIRVIVENDSRIEVAPDGEAFIEGVAVKKTT